MEIVECWCGPSGSVEEALKLTLLVVLLGGLACALLATALALRTRRRGVRWSSRWSQPFLTGLRFQWCSLAWWVPVSSFLTYESFLTYDIFGAGVAVLAGIALLPVACSVVGVRAWYALRDAVSLDDRLGSVISVR